MAVVLEKVKSAFSQISNMQMPWFLAKILIPRESSIILFELNSSDSRRMYHTDVVHHARIGGCLSFLATMVFIVAMIVILCASVLFVHMECLVAFEMVVQFILPASIAILSIALPLAIFAIRRHKARSMLRNKTKIVEYNMYRNFFLANAKRPSEKEAVLFIKENLMFKDYLNKIYWSENLYLIENVFPSAKDRSEDENKMVEYLNVAAKEVVSPWKKKK